METVKVNIKGMSCGHCVNAVEKALRKVPGVTVEQVGVGKAQVRLDTAVAKADDVVRAIDQAGYDAQVAG